MKFFTSLLLAVIFGVLIETMIAKYLLVDLDQQEKVDRRPFSCPLDPCPEDTKCNEATGQCENARPHIGNYPRWIPGMSRDHPACEVPPGCCCDSCYPCDYDTDHVIAKAISQKNVPCDDPDCFGWCDPITQECMSYKKGNARSCLREGEHSPDQHSCCQGLARCPKTGLCLGQDVKVQKVSPVASKGPWQSRTDGGCAYTNRDCFVATRMLNGHAIQTEITMRMGCTECKGSCCDFTTKRIGANHPEQPVQIKMARGCSDCKGCCDDGTISRAGNVNHTAMIRYCDDDDFRVDC